MAKGTLVDLLLAAASRPHARCSRHAQRQIGQIRSYALAHRKKDSPSTPTPPKGADPLLAPRKPAQVPLAVGIDRNPENKSAISRIPIPKGVKGEKFVPSPLARPLGLKSPPQPGQNSSVDRRSWEQKKADFTDYDRAVERRQIYLRTFLRPYFQEWHRLDKEFKGKSFVANERLFRKDKALYFPNMWGQTLSKKGQGPDGGYDTTPALRGKISIVGIQSGVWAQEQADTFLSEESNPELQTLLKDRSDVFQRADINIQDNIAKAFLVKLFSGRLRATISEDRWDRYFMVKLPRDVRLGLSDDVRDAMGFLNTAVGYVYLLDADCKIRWAGSGHAWKEELESLSAGIKRLLEEADAERKLNNIPANGLRNILAEDVQVSNPPMAAAA